MPKDQVPADSVPSSETQEPITGAEKELSSRTVLETGTISQGEKEPNEDQILEKWGNLNIPALIERGYQYRVKTKANGKQYMALRKGKTDKGIGGYTSAREKLLFEHYPTLKEDFFRRHPSGDRRSTAKRKKPFLSVPIRRVAVVPTNYRPTLEVIRYFHVFKKNGFPGDFSDFINGNLEDHFVKCNGIILPVLLEDQEEDRLIKNVQ